MLCVKSYFVSVLCCQFRCVEETTNALETLHGEIFQGAIIKLTRPKAYVAPPGKELAKRSCMRDIPLKNVGVGRT